MNKIVNEVAQIINNMSHKKDNLIIAIDGRCASGKTTLAKELAESFDCNVFHMDDFFLRPEQRTEDRLKQAGENVDHERFLVEVLNPLVLKDEIMYRRFNCKTMRLMEPVKMLPKKINIIEGSYSCHNELFSHYDLKIFLSVERHEQKQRIIARNGEEAAKVFEEKWIPMEENYFKIFNIERRCDYFFKN